MELRDLVEVPKEPLAPIRGSGYIGLLGKPLYIKD